MHNTDALKHIVCILGLAPLIQATHKNQPIEIKHLFHGSDIDYTEFDGLRTFVIEFNDRDETVLDLNDFRSAIVEDNVIYLPEYEIRLDLYKTVPFCINLPVEDQQAAA